jgi:organic radical activating enzyme
MTGLKGPMSGLDPRNGHDPPRGPKPQNGAGPFRLNEIFLSVQGEGLHVGERTIFIRFYGCPLRCVWCDQPEALAHTGVGRFETVSRESLLDRIRSFHHARRVCLTGGEPVLAPRASLLWLLGELRARGYWTSIETSGARIVEELFPWIDFWTVSPKGRSAQTFRGDLLAEQVPRLRRFLELPETRRQFKFVIQDPGDLEDAVSILDALEYRGAIVLQPEHARGDGRAIFAAWPWERYPEARLIPQTHKSVGLR